MCFCSRSFIAALLIMAPAAGFAASCTTQAALAPEDRGTLASIGEQLVGCCLRQDTSALQSVLLPALAGQWDGIREAVEECCAAGEGRQGPLRNMYLLDASTLTAPSDTQFFCSNANGSMTVTISMHALPPGKYALILSDAAGARWQVRWDSCWCGIRQGLRDGSWADFRRGRVTFDGHDAVWYWTRARELTKSNLPWARGTLRNGPLPELPVDFLSSPNLDKLAQEQQQIKGAPAEDSFPYSVTSGDRTWKIDGSAAGRFVARARPWRYV